MTKHQIHQMINSRTLVLTKQQLFWHYSIIPLLLIAPILTTVDVFKLYVFHTYSNTHEIDYYQYLWILPACIFYLLQRGRLKFKVIDISVDSDCFNKAIEESAKDLEWTISHHCDDCVIAGRSWNWTASWGELITIIRDKDKILLNSICDPDNVPSVASWGMNKLNIKTFIKHINECAGTASINNPETRI
jgi:hypothetical protein